ncbi:hypothetical protein TIFTF001_008277 [Ficus carica]|uniref:Uncharacterized protein n=1 Tax=Ficus carica TaxID=3494 RepID=A0AA88AES1_FICCA|nr:hypothetical protein TIFTF001_008277 [Ficus carica]
MSWIRTAVNMAVDKDHLRRTVRSYADFVVVQAGNAVAGGARIIQDRIVGFRSLPFKHTVKRLEDVSVLCRGVERVQLLRRWLVALKQIERSSSSSSSPCTCHDHDHGHDVDASPGEHPSCDELMDHSPRKPTLVHYFDSSRDEPRNFRDVFLHSQALEGITLSMILEAPNQEEASLLVEIYMYGLCLTGGKEVHHLVMGKVQALAEAFSGYKEEVLIKREELLQFAQGAISGLKINADLARIDAEACSIKEKLEKTKFLEHSSDEGSKKTCKKTTTETSQDQEQALAEICLCFNLEALLLRKKSLGNRDSPELHDEKDEALSYRAAKANEVHQAEKVNTSLAAARMRLHHTKEERDQLDEASDQILVHFKTKEDELLKSIASCRAEAKVVDTWIKFLEDTWLLQTSYAEQKEKQVMGDIERWGDHFVSLVIHLLSSFKEKLGQSITRIRLLVENFSKIHGSQISLGKDEETPKVTNPRKDFEVEYLDVESKQFYVPTEGIIRKNDEKIKGLFEAIEKFRDEFESSERPALEIETPTQKSVMPFNARNNTSPTKTSSKMTQETPNQRQKTQEPDQSDLLELDSEFEAEENQ